MKKSWKVLGVSVGCAVEGALLRNGKPERSAYMKQLVDGPVDLDVLGLPGDEHVYRTHGGLDRALLGYSRTQYRYWEDRYGIELPPFAALGENLTTQGATDEEIYIGDIFELGTATVEVSQPRQPCWKHSARYGVSTFTLDMVHSGYTGFLMRVVRPGCVGANPELSLVFRPRNTASVAEAARIIYRDRSDIDGARHLASIPQLAAYSRGLLDTRLGTKGKDRDRDPAADRQRTQGRLQ